MGVGYITYTKAVLSSFRLLSSIVVDVVVVAAVVAIAVALIYG